MAGAGGFLKSFTEGLMAAALAFIVARPGVTENDVALFVGVGSAAHILFSLASGCLADRFGRRPLVVAAAVLPFAAVAAFCLPSDGIGFLSFGNALKGACFGILTAMVPLVLAENLPAGGRGRGSALFQLSMQTGAVFGALAGAGAAWLTGTADAPGPLSWRLYFILALLPAVPFLLLALRTPRMVRPVWKPAGGKPPKAAHQTGFQSDYARPLLLAAAFMALMSLSGTGTVLGYSVVLMEKAGFSGVPANLMNAVLQGAMIVPVVFAWVLVDVKGRRFLLRIGTAGMIVGMAGSGAVFHLIEHGCIGVSPSAGIAFAAFLVLTVSLFVFGPASCAWAVIPELLPARIRAKGMSVALLCNQLATLGTSVLFLPVAKRTGFSFCFFFFAAAAFLYFLLVLFALPETKGVPLEEGERRLTERQQSVI